MQVTFVQYAGDYREAFERLSAGGCETYQAQRYSVNFVGSLPYDVSVVCAVCEEAYDVRLPNGVRAIGAGLKPGFDARDLIPFVEGTDRLILVSPMVPLLKWARRNKVRTITAMADSFRRRSLKQLLRNRWIARHLNSAEWVGNHQLPASRSLRSIGVIPEKIVPWDWPPSHTPRDYAARTLRDGKTFDLLYVGSICEAKGVADLIRAVSDHDYLRLTLVGPILESMPSAKNVQFAGIIPNDEIPAAMREADAVVVPSRHEYPEGLPLVIYEALASRTPIIASDHPMFPLDDQESALIFPAADPWALLAATQRLASDPDLYAKLSANSLGAWEALQIPVTWGEFIERWLSDDVEWLKQSTLASSVATARRIGKVRSGSAANFLERRRA